MRVLAGLILVTLAVGAAGCGSSGPTGGSGAGSAASSKDPAFAYARCMRSHGVPGFPDPQVTVSPGQTSVRMTVPASMGQSPHFKTADRACSGILPQPGSGADGHHGPGAKVLLAFAKCLRSHGESSFPDPDAQGRITPQMISSAGVNLRTPVFLSAARSCIGVTHGAITPAEIHAAITGPH